MTKTAYCRAVARVEGDLALVGLADILLAAWPDDDDHFHWVATAPPADLVAWADQIRKAETKAAQGPVNHICDVCGWSSGDLEAVVKHLAEAHGIDAAGEVGKITQGDGLLILDNGGDKTVIDLDRWLCDLLDQGKPQGDDWPALVEARPPDL